MSPQPGEVWLADLGLAGKTRPLVIVSRHDPDPPRALILYVPLTTQDRHSSYEVPLPRAPFLDRDSVPNVQGLGSLPRVRLERRLGRLPDEVMTGIKRALAFSTGPTPSRCGTARRSWGRRAWEWTAERGVKHGLALAGIPPVPPSDPDSRDSGGRPRPHCRLGHHGLLA